MALTFKKDSLAKGLMMKKNIRVGLKK